MLNGSSGGLASFAVIGGNEEMIPLRGNLVLKPWKPAVLAAAQLTEGGIVVPDMGSDTPTFEVVAVPDVWEINAAGDATDIVPVKPGDRVAVLGGVSGTWYNGEQRALCKCYQVVAIIPKNAKMQVRDTSLHAAFSS